MVKTKNKRENKTISLVKDLNKASEMLLDMLYDLDKDKAGFHVYHAGGLGVVAKCMAGRKALNGRLEISGFLLRKQLA